MNTTLLINYLDQLRKERSLKQAPFIDGIVSQRQYSRYKKGINDVPFDVIIQLSDRLDVSLSVVIAAFEQSISNEANDVTDFFNCVVRGDIEEAKHLDNHLRNKQFIRPILKHYYKIAQLLLNYHEKRLDVATFVKALKKTLGYPHILDNTTLSDHEIYVLGLIMQYDKEEISVILDKLVTIDRLKHFIDIKDPYLVLRSQFFIIKNLGRQKRFEEVIDFADQAIDFCTHHHVNYLLENLYYYKALGHYYLKQHDAFEAALKETILEVLRKPKPKQDKFFTMIEKDTKINPKTFIKVKLFT